MRAPVLETTPEPQSEDILQVVFSDQYPLDANERLRYLADHYHGLPLDMVIIDTFWASAQRADEWVAQRNVSRGRASHVSGHVAALQEALMLVGTEDDVSVTRSNGVRQSIRNITNGRDSFGDEIEGEKELLYRAISLRTSIANADVGDNVKRALENIFQAETAKRYIVRELEEHWAGTPTDGFPLSVLSQVGGRSNPANRIRGYWKGRTIAHTRNGVGLIATDKIMQEQVKFASRALLQEASERGIDMELADVDLLLEQMRAVVNLRTSEREKGETAIELRVPVIEAFKNLSTHEVQMALEDLWLHNHKMFTPSTFRLLGLAREDVDVFSDLADKDRRHNEAQEQARVEQLHAEYEKFLKDCADPELLKMTYEQLSGQVISMPGVAKKYGGGVLRYVQAGVVTQSTRHGQSYETLSLRRIIKDEATGKLTVAEQQIATVTTFSILRRIMTGEIQIVNDIEVEVPNRVKNAAPQI